MYDYIFYKAYLIVFPVTWSLITEKVWYYFLAWPPYHVTRNYIGTSFSLTKIGSDIKLFSFSTALTVIIRYARENFRLNPARCVIVRKWVAMLFTHGLLSRSNHRTAWDREVGFPTSLIYLYTNIESSCIKMQVCTSRSKYIWLITRYIQAECLIRLVACDVQTAIIVARVWLHAATTT